MPAKFVHINIIAKDWRSLSEFYETVFGCKRVLPERSLAGKWLDDAVGLTNTKISGIHLRLPGYGEQGPTLEIFQYEDFKKSTEPAPNKKGLSHLAFVVNDVAAISKKVCQAGGKEIGKISETIVQGAGKICFQYVIDPEGNIIELQKWD